MKKNYLLILSLLALGACSKSKGDNPSGETPSISITVWDASKWSSSKPKGELSAGATVKLYTSQEAFVSSTDHPAYTATTGTDGVAQLKGVADGTYYVVVSKGNISNVFSTYSQAYDNIWLGYAADTVLDNAGNFIWKDLNFDGKVDTHDQGGQPALSVQVEKSKLVNTSVMIGYRKKPLTTVAEVQVELDGVYAGLSTLYKNLDRKSTRLNSSHYGLSRMPSSA